MGRDDDLARLHATLQQNSSVAISTVTGMGGIGKTELALQYAQRYWEEFYPGGALWLQAREADLGVQILNFARVQMQLNPPEELDFAAKIAYCWRNWRGEGNVLVILDDVTNYQTVEPYLPPNLPQFNVIVTTRVQNLAQSFASLDLEVLEEPAALELLASLIGETRLNQEEEAAKTLCEWLGYLPLGLELVGQYLAQRQDLSLVKMQQRLEKKRLEHKSLEEPTSQTTAQQGVKAAFELSWQDLATEAKEMACLLSLFALAPIPWEKVEACLSEEDEEDLEDIRDGVLVRLSLLQRVEAGWFQLHSLLREFLRDKLEALEVADGLKRKYCQVMIRVAKQVPQSPTIQDIKRLAPIVPHLTETATTWVDWVEDEDLAWAFVSLSRYYQGQGLYGSAEPWKLACLPAVRARLGEKHPYVADSLNNLAELYKSQRRYEEAETHYLRALELRQNLLGDKHPDVAISLNNLAELYKSQRRYEEAESLFLRALELMQKLLGEELLKHPYIATFLNNLAGLYKAREQYQEAETLHLRALELRQNLLGDKHPDVAISLNNLAELYKSQRRYEEAESLFLRALELRQNLLGEKHPGVAIVLMNLAELYTSQERYEEAGYLLRQAISVKLSAEVARSDEAETQ